MTADEAYQLADAAVFRTTGRHLKDVEREILIGSFNGESYSKIAAACHRSDKYLGRDAGPKLWELLTGCLGEPVSKSNIRAVLERRSHTVLPPRPTPPRPSLLLHEVDVSWTSENPRQCWNFAPDVSCFYGREPELTQLEEQIHIYGCRLLTIVGMGGIGKTALAIRLAHQVKGQFDCVVWQSLRTAPILTELLVNLMQDLAGQSAQRFESIDHTTVLDYLTQHRCLVILDGLETVLQPHVHSGCYQERYTDYELFFQQVGRSIHRSCLLLTSREKPRNLALMEGETQHVYSLQLQGLGELAGREFFLNQGIAANTESDWNILVRRHAGNPQVLNCVATHIREVFSGNANRFLAESHQDAGLLSDIARLLAVQLERLSPLEQGIMQCLNQTDEPMKIADFVQAVTYSRMEVQEGLQSLIRRSLVEVVMDYYSLPHLVSVYLNYH